MKRVLWVTSWFPPRVGVATIRNIKFLKYLPQFGWEARVICPLEMMEHTPQSRKLLNQLSASITVSPGPRDFFYYLLDRRQGNRGAQYLVSLMNNIVPPDGHLLWALSALFHVAREVKRYQPDAVYTNCSPFSGNLIGAWVKYRYKLPWVTDFRDLWTLNPMSKKRFFSSYYAAVSDWLERFYLKRCDALIVNTENSRSRMVEKYQMLTDKTWIIPNGYDQDDIKPEPESGSIPRSLFFGGTIDQQTTYTPLPLLELISKLPEYGHEYANWVLHYAGYESEALVELARAVQVPFECKTHGYLDQATYYDLIQRMEYVMLCMPLGVESKSWIPARVYDYIGNRKRIICLAYSDSEVSRLLKQYGDSIVLYYDEPEEQRIRRLHGYLLGERSNHQPAEEFFNRLARRELTGRLAQVLEEITCYHGQPRSINRVNRDEWTPIRPRP